MPSDNRTTSRLKGVLANLCLAVAVCAFFMFIHNWAIGDTGNSQWAFATMLTGWIACMLLRREDEHD